MGEFLQYTVIGLTVGSFYALVALGYTIVYGIIRLINFAQGDLSMVGAFLGWTLLVSFGLDRLPLYLALIIAFGRLWGVTGAGAAVLVSTLAYAGVWVALLNAIKAERKFPEGNAIG